MRSIPYGNPVISLDAGVMPSCLGATGFGVAGGESYRRSTAGHPGALGNSRPIRDRRQVRNIERGCFRMKDALLALYALQEVDTALAVARRKLDGLDRGDAERAAAESARTLFERISRTLHDTSRDLTDAELELQSVEQKKKQYEDRLYGGRVTNPKELTSMQEEIEALGRQRGRLEERILVLMDQVDALKAQVREAQEKHTAADALLNEKEAAYREAYREISERIAALDERRAKAREAVPVALLKRYEAIQAQRGGVGAARIEGNVCSVCHTSLPTNLIRRVQAGESVELCENCGRILCYVAS